MTVGDDTDVVLISQRGQTLARKVGFSKTGAAALGTALSELGSNIVRYAQRGSVRLWVLQDEDRCGILVEAADHGPGIPDVDEALTDGFTTGGSLGGGLGGAKRLVDRFDIETSPDKGTTVRLLKWA
jgi:serine/threonine-protein kinase RsbT